MFVQPQRVAHRLAGSYPMCVQGIQQQPSSGESFRPSARTYRLPHLPRHPLEPCQVDRHDTDDDGRGSPALNDEVPLYPGPPDGGVVGVDEDGGVGGVAVGVGEDLVDVLDRDAEVGTSRVEALPLRVDDDARAAALPDEDVGLQSTAARRPAK